MRHSRNIRTVNTWILTTREQEYGCSRLYLCNDVPDDTAYFPFYVVFIEDIKTIKSLETIEELEVMEPWGNLRLLWPFEAKTIMFFQNASHCHHGKPWINWDFCNLKVFEHKFLIFLSQLVTDNPTPRDASKKKKLQYWGSLTSNSLIGKAMRHLWCQKPLERILSRVFSAWDRFFGANKTLSLIPWEYPLATPFTLFLC